jgi:excisionase family DNA binding protein
MPRSQSVLNIREAAEFLRAHEQTIRRLARRGEIPAFKVGADWRFHEAALVRWLEEQQSGGSGRSVLIVDDEELVCRALVAMLSELGVQTDFTTKAAEGLDLLRSKAWGLVLLDLKMPDMTGAQFLRELRRTHPDLPVAIVTGYPDSDLMQDAIQYAPLVVIAKPVDQEQVVRTVRLAFGPKVAAGRK